MECGSKPFYEAIEEGWTPYFYEGDKEHEFACSGCPQAILRVDDIGEMEVKEEYRGKLRYLDKGAEEAWRYDSYNISVEFGRIHIEKG